MGATQESEKAVSLLAVDWGPGWELDVGVHASLLAIAAIIIGLIVLLRVSRFGIRGQDFQIDQAELGLGDQKITLKPNYLDRTVAYKIWVELSTRKIGLPIDLDHDILVEIYDSWYSFFQITRELIKDIPVSKVRDKSTKQIINLSIDILNHGLRPHLTKWQARFRRWYEKKMDAAPHVDLHPQQIQEKFPDFEELKAELLVLNTQLMAYRTRMSALVNAR